MRKFTLLLSLRKLRREMPRLSCDCRVWLVLLFLCLSCIVHSTVHAVNNGVKKPGKDALIKDNKPVHPNRERLHGLKDSERVNKPQKEAVGKPRKKPTTKSPSNGFVTLHTPSSDALCAWMRAASKMKFRVSKHLSSAIRQLKGNKPIKSKWSMEVRSSDEKKEESDEEGAEVLEEFRWALERRERLIISSVAWLRETVASEYKDFATLQSREMNRLAALRNVTLEEEQYFERLSKAIESYRKKKELQDGEPEGLVAKVLQEVSLAADDLQNGLNHHIFDIAMQQPSGVQTVVRMKQKEGAPRLVDVEENQFVLSRSKDLTYPLQDHVLIHDIVLVFITSLLFGLLCYLANLPILFGEILAGVVLGPAMLNHLQALVQIESIGEFGVFFIMFCLGLEFSPVKIQKTV